MKYRMILQLTACALALAVYSTAFAADPEKQRAEIRKMCDAALATLYKAKPDMQTRISKSSGYGCFSSFGLSFIVGGAGGSGLVHNNETNTDTFMNMGQATAGVEAGIKNYREVLLFKDKNTLQKFVDSGWEFSTEAAASAMAGGKGASAEASASGREGIEVYPLTKTGLALGASIGGRKYWKDKDLAHVK